MLFHRSAIAATLLLAVTTSQADSFVGSLDLSGGGAHFGRDNAVGVFEDIYNFTLPTPGYLISASTGTASPDAAHDLDLSNPLITNSAGATIATFAGNRGTDANESYWLPSVLLPADNYKLVISGINSLGQASYSGNLSVSAIPEPASYAMFMAGLALALLMTRRRQRGS